MQSLILSNNDLRKLVRHVGVDKLMDEIIDRLSKAFEEFDDQTTEISPRTGFYYDTPYTGLIEWMPLFQKHEKVLIKIVGYHPASPMAYQLPTIISSLSTYDTATGHLIALVDGTFLTALRTGAASAVASRWLARPDSTVLGLIGCGAQGVTQLHAISRVFEIAEVLIYDLDPTISATFAARAEVVASNGLKITPVSIDTILQRSDIISVATSVEVGKGPVFQTAMTQPWVHFNAVGSDLPGKTELPIDFLKRCFVCPDDLTQARHEGECQQLRPEEIGSSLIEVARRPADYQFVQQQKSVFDSTGSTLADLVAMDLVLEYADQLGLGTSVPIESVSGDPHNPYDFLQPTVRSVGETGDADKSVA